MIMKWKMKSTVGVCLLFFVLLEAMCCEGCWKEERNALLALNSRFDLPYSWDGPDCCQWYGVKCNSSTGRVAKLHISHNFREQYSTLNYSDFVVFKDLKNLDLSGNDISGCAGTEARLENLEVLDMSDNYLDTAAILSCLDGLSSLKSLYLRYNSFNTSSFYVFETLASKLPNLEVLDISENSLTNDILPSLGGFTSLKELNLANIDLDSDLHIQGLCLSLWNLEVLDLHDNNFNNSDIIFVLSGLSSLKSLYLKNCQLTTKSIFKISKLSSLEMLDLSDNNFNDSDITYALSGLSSLKSLYLGHCQLTTRSIFNISKSSALEMFDLSSNNFNDSDITYAFIGLSSLKSLYLVDCQLTSRSTFNISKSSALEMLDLSGNNFNDSDITYALSGLSSLKSLYLVDCQLTSRSTFNISRLSSLKTLDLSSNWLNESIPCHQDFHELSNLEHLILDFNNNLENEFLKNIGELISLKVLSLQECDINGTLPPTDWFKLKKLEELDLSGNKFEGLLPSSFVNMTSLRRLKISDNYFIGNFDSNLASLTSLEYFDFSENQFEVPVSFIPFANLSKIKFIYGEGNKVLLDSQHNLQTWIPKFQLQELIVSSTTETKSLPLPNFLLYQNSLINIDLSIWKLEGDFPHWLLENNTKMTQALFRNCSFTGTFQLPMSPLPNIREIDVSGNTINGQIPSNNISSIYPNLQYLDLSRNNIQGSIPSELGQMSFLYSLDLSENHLSGKILENNISSIYPNLHYLDLSRNNIQGSIPSELGQMSFLYSLDLSENNLSGKIPENIFGDGHQLQCLKLSNNKLEGPILNIPSGLEILLLNDNRFTGRLPSNIFQASISALDVRNNHLVGKIPSIIKKSSNLEELYMSNNHFEGPIPLELGELEDLSYLDLSQNNLSGHVPSFANSPVKFMHLNNNHLSGLSKRMFNENSSIVMLDLSYNEISNNIQDMILDLSYTRLNFLLLKGNRFIGDIPKQLCKLTYLSILDLSHNNFSGTIPNCLGKMPFEVEDSEELLQYFYGVRLDNTYNRVGSQLPNVQEKTNFTSKKRTDTYMGSILVYMSGIDLSQNKLKGNIPSELGNLTKIRTLNLSHNDLTGKIPATFSHLVQTESLDLSFNMLNGQIPSQLSTLTSLEVFSVAHNNLSGPTPEFKGQFSTFDESSYEGNPFLCGLPLPKSCNPPPTVIPNDSDIDGHYDTLVDMYVFCLSFVVSYTSALLVTAAALYINPYWRQACFYYMELVSMNCYYFIRENWSKFFKISNI